MSVGQGVHMNTTYIMQINSEHHGMSYVNFFNTCTDNICMDNVKKLKPRVIRFPSAGDADCYTMNVDTAGYGIDFPDVAAYFADRFNSLQNPLTFTPFTNTYLCPLAIDPLQVPLHYNASVPAVFSNATDSANFCSELEDWYNDYRKQRTQITQSYLTKFIQHVKEIEDSLQPGERVNIIYVANIFSGTPADLVTTLKQLTDVQL
ncbi:MAG: hypothetical protein IT235_02045, partial [Bacteroidia bacterium]|nr:hypothetical protein [Bacteroidia bacterium]